MIYTSFQTRHDENGGEKRLTHQQVPGEQPHAEPNVPDITQREKEHTQRTPEQKEAAERREEIRKAKWTPEQSLQEADRASKIADAEAGKEKNALRRANDGIAKSVHEVKTPGLIRPPEEAVTLKDLKNMKDYAAQSKARAAEILKNLRKDRKPVMRSTELKADPTTRPQTNNGGPKITKAEAGIDAIVGDDMTKIVKAVASPEDDIEKAGTPLADTTEVAWEKVAGGERRRGTDGSFELRATPVVGELRGGGQQYTDTFRPGPQIQTQRLREEFGIGTEKNTTLAQLTKELQTRKADLAGAEREGIGGKAVRDLREEIARLQRQVDAPGKQAPATSRETRGAGITLPPNADPRYLLYFKRLVENTWANKDDPKIVAKNRALLETGIAEVNQRYETQITLQKVADEYRPAWANVPANTNTAPRAPTAAADTQVKGPAAAPAPVNAPAATPATAPAPAPDVPRRTPQPNEEQQRVIATLQGHIDKQFTIAEEMLKDGKITQEEATLVENALRSLEERTKNHAIRFPDGTMRTFGEYVQRNINALGAIDKFTAVTKKINDAYKSKHRFDGLRDLGTAWREANDTFRGKSNK